MSPLQAYFGVEGRLGITVLSKAIDPAVVSAGFLAPLIGDKGFTLSVKAPYGPSIPYNKPATGSLEIKDEQSADINGEVRTTIVLGIIPVTFAAGVRGKAGIEYGVGITAYGSTPDKKPIDNEWYTKASQATVAKSTFGIGLHGHADVFANVTMYASAVAGGEVDLGLCTVGASLGVKTEMTLFDGRTVFEVDALIEKPVDAKPHGKMTYSGNFNITSALAGDLFIEAKLDFCIKSVKYRYYLWSDPGVHGKSYPLFSPGEPEGDISDQ